MIGLNVLSNFVRDRAALAYWLKTARPGLVVVMDDPAYAQQVKRDAPTAVVVHRSYHPRDNEFHLFMSPADWLNAYAPTVAPGVLLQCLNEPDGYTNLPTLVNWCVQVMKLAHERGIALCVPNFAVGHPDTALVGSGALDPLLRALAAYPEHRLGLHEYWRADPTAEPYLVGRFTAILDRATAIGVTAPRILITEYGRDHAGGLNDGWRGVGLTEERYAELLISTHRRVYAPRNIPAAVFCYATSPDRKWWSFDVEGARTVLAGMAQYNATQATPAALQSGTLTATLSNVVNVRGQPTTAAAVLRTLKAGDAVRYNPTAISGGAYTANGKTLTGWYALDSGYIAAGVVTIGAPGEAPDTPIKRIDVPFVSQLGTDASKRANDCGVACSLMLIQHTLKRAGLRTMRGLTVNRLIEDTPLVSSDAPLGLSALIALLDAYGVSAVIAPRPVNADAVVRYLDAGKPPILLVNYAAIGGESIGHYVVCVAYGERGFWLHDPYKRGAEVYVTRADLDRALATVTDIGAASFPYQGIALA